MPERNAVDFTLSVAELVSLDHIQYAQQVKARMRYPSLWVVLLDPLLLERTRAALHRMVQSIDAQRERIEKAGTAEESWLRSIATLRRAAKAKLEAIPPATDSDTRGSRAWRAFAAQLATALLDNDSTALNRIQTPYGGLSALEWLRAREEKQESGR